MDEFLAQAEPINEDCLCLNVGTTEKSKSEKQQIFIWFYGDGLNSG
jgi:para-nitrobenzyl esterase